MDVFIEPIGRLINEFSRLPGVGKKTAQRYAYKIVDMSETEARAFADAIINVKQKVRYCKICGNFTEGDVCEICKRRDPSVICVVKEPLCMALMIAIVISFMFCVAKLCISSSSCAQSYSFLP